MNEAPHGVVGPAAEKCGWLWCCIVKDICERLRERASEKWATNKKKEIGRKGAGDRVLSRACV